MLLTTRLYRLLRVDERQLFLQKSVHLTAILIVQKRRPFSNFVGVHLTIPLSYTRLVLYTKGLYESVRLSLPKE